MVTPPDRIPVPLSSLPGPVQDVALERERRNDDMVTRHAEWAESKQDVAHLRAVADKIFQSMVDRCRTRQVTPDD